MDSLLQSQVKKASLLTQQSHFKRLIGSYSSPAECANPRIIGGPKLSPSALDRVFLKWSGQYKTTTEVPKLLDSETIFRARSYARIRINVGFLFLAAALSGLMVYSGKQAALQHQSLELANLDWHKRLNEQHLRDQMREGALKSFALK